MKYDSQHAIETLAPLRTEEFKFGYDERLQAADEFRELVDGIMLDNLQTAHRAFIVNQQTGDRQAVLTLGRVETLEDGSTVVMTVKSTQSASNDQKNNVMIEFVSWGNADEHVPKDSRRYTLGDEPVVRRYDITAEEWTSQVRADICPHPGPNRLAFEQGVGLNNHPVGLDEVRAVRAALLGE